MQWFPFSLLMLGVVLSVVGWFFDRAKDIEWFLRVVDSRFYFGSTALDGLALSPQRGLPPTNEGFHAVLSVWPHPITAEVAAIGRSVAFMEFGSQVTNDFELILYDATKVEIGPRWRHSAAVQALSERLDRRVFRIGAVVFWLGIGITLASGIVDLVH